MSDAQDHNPQPAKPSRLSGLVAPKGVAPRPGEAISSAQAVAEPATTPRTAAVSPPPPAGTGSKSLTLRLPDAEYERLRARAYATRMTHQAILAEALRRYLDEAEGA